jgi:signal transduction histidine kinase
MSPVLRPADYLIAALVIALLSSHLAFDLLRWARSQPWHTQRHRILAAGVTLGAGGAAMHILAILAMENVYYFRVDVAGTILAFVTGVGGAWAGLAVARWSAGRRGWIAGGLLLGTGSVLMHFGAVAAMTPRIAYRSLPLAGLSVAMALISSAAALYVTLRASGPDRAIRWHTVLLAPLITTVGRFGMHFTAMTAISRQALLVPAGTLLPSPTAVTPFTNLLGVALLITFGVAVISAYWKEQASQELTMISERMRPYFFVLDAGWQFTYLNQAMAERFPERSLLGAQIWEAFGGILPPSLRQQYERVIRDQVQVRFQEFMPLSQRWHDILAFPSGNGVAVCFWDIDDQKQGETVMREQAVARERERTRDRFIHLAAHELRNPMAGVKGILSLMRRRIAQGRPPGDLAELAATMEREVDRMSALLDQVFEAFRRESGRLEFRQEPVDLVQVVAAALRPYMAGSEKHRFISAGLANPPVWVQGDPQRLEEVVRNLVHNAVKYSPDGGEIRVVLRPCGGAVQLSVSDQGIGIAPEQLEQIFEGFFRGSNFGGHDPGGLGLGLHICRDTVQRHGGRIWAESVEGEGSTFHMELPLFRQHPPRPREAAPD